MYIPMPTQTSQTGEHPVQVVVDKIGLSLSAQMLTERF